MIFNILSRFTKINSFCFENFHWLRLIGFSFVLFKQDLKFLVFSFRLQVQPSFSFINVHLQYVENLQLRKYWL
jgi:hypothetical protein